MTNHQRVILGHPVTPPPPRRIAALLPAAVAVAILGFQIDRGDSPDTNERSERLRQMSPVAPAHASQIENDALSLDEATDPAAAQTFDLPEQGIEVAAAGDVPAPIINLKPLDPAAAAAPEVEPEPAVEAQRISVKPGDSLSGLLSAAGVRAEDWLALAKIDGDARRLRTLRPGESFDLVVDDNARLVSLAYALSPLESLHITRGPNESFLQARVERPYRTQTHQLSGTITDSLYLSARQMGLSDRMVMQLADIFAWDIDFERDVRRGDRLQVVYEQAYEIDGEAPLGNPRVIAVQYQQRDRALQAVHFTPAEGRAGYFNADGRPMRKAFLRTPVEFTRISSRFSKARKHPVLNKIRAHRGVDYAAGHGTPIRATGDARVAFAGTKGGYGRTIVLEHNGKYRTLYAHMSRFARGLRQGSRVRQGDTIGYVGASGLATGPHLHYEFHVNGVHVDPLGVALPAADPLPKTEMPRFAAHAEPLIARLAMLAAEDTLAQATP